MSQEKLYSVKEAAERLDISGARVRQLCQEGRIVAFKIGNRWVMTDDSLKAFESEPRRAGRPRQQEDEPDA